MKHLPTIKHVERLAICIEILSQVNTLADVPITPPFRRHKLLGEKKDWFSVRILEGWRLCFSVVENDESMNSSDLSAVTTVQIEAIEDYHD